jgi:hypothetical protein
LIIGGHAALLPLCHSHVRNLQHALKRAMEENPELAAEFEGKLARKVGGTAWA